MNQSAPASAQYPARRPIMTGDAFNSDGTHHIIATASVVLRGADGTTRTVALQRGPDDQWAAPAEIAT